MELIEKYGTYNIRKGTRLFRKSADEIVKEEMFFGFSPLASYSSYIKTREIQIWETILEINGFLMLKENPTINRKISAAIEIYNFYFPENKLQCNDYVNVKKYCNERNQLIKILKSMGITNWVCSVENKFEMELFLFNSIENNMRLIKYIETVGNNSSCLNDVDTFEHKSIKYK